MSNCGFTLMTGSILRIGWGWDEIIFRNNYHNQLGYLAVITEIKINYEIFV